jgi:SAM-dependent methyltransferase
MIKKFVLTETFMPTMLSIIFNPVYLLRRGIYREVKAKATVLQGDILDFGCGSKPYMSLFPHAKSYIGVDFESVESSKNPAIDVYYDGKTIPFPDNHFDAIFCTEVLEHIFNKEEILPELYRVLKPQGVGLFTFPFAWPEHAQPWDYARYTTFSTKFIFEKYQFKIKSIEKTGNFIEVIFQFIVFYLFSILPFKSTKVKMILLIPFTMILNLLGLVFSFILPKQNDLYFNNIVLVTK